MEYKNKYILPFNFKAKFIMLVGVLFTMLGILTCITKAKEHKWGIMIGAIACTLFFIVGITVLFCRGLKLKQDRVVLPNEYTTIGKQTETIVEYKDIQKVEYIGKKDEGPHIQSALGKNVDTLVIMNKQGKKYLLSLDLYSKKQIKYIIEEISNRANIND